jgi:hypothetical protein
MTAVLASLHVPNFMQEVGGGHHNLGAQDGSGEAQRRQSLMLLHGLCPV